MILVHEIIFLRGWVWRTTSTYPRNKLVKKLQFQTAQSKLHLVIKGSI